MNYILSILFLLVISIYYQMTGRKVLSLLHYEASFDLAFLAGFLIVAFIGFVIGVPLQYLGVSWKIYFISMSIALIGAGIFSFNKEMFKITLKDVLEFIQEHYLIILLSVALVGFAMCNLLPYYVMNYDDNYYIGKIVNQIGTVSLSNENYFSGMVSSVSGDMTRILNTYEILYGYFASLFHIGVPFFCRCTMAFHNYVLTFVVYKLFAEIFVSKKYSQYTVAFFAIFFISAGYWFLDDDAPFRIKMYDQWQISTAIWYGGSVVRMIAIPAIIVLGKELWQKLSIQKLIMVVIAYCSFISYSTVFLHYGIILFYLFLAAECIAIMFSGKRFSFLGLAGLIVLIYALFYVNDHINSIPILKSFVDEENLVELGKYYDQCYAYDFVYLNGMVILSACFILGKDKYQRYCLIPIAGLYLLEYKQSFVNFMLSTTFGYYFVAMRLISSMQIMILFMIALMIVKALETIKIHHFICGILALSFIGWCGNYFNENYKAITDYDYAGAGVCPYRYSTDPVTNNDDLVPDLVVELGDYFDDLPYGNYQIVTPNSILLNEDGYVPYSALVIASNRIEIYNGGHQTGIEGLSSDDFSLIQSYFEGSCSYESIASIVKDCSIDYLLVQSESQKEELQSYGCSVVLENTSEPYYLLKTGV